VNELRRETKLAGLGYALFITAFFLAFGPYAFADGGKEAAEIMGGTVGMVSAISAALVALGGVASCLMSVVFSIQSLRQGPQGQSVAALFLALLPLLLIGLFIWQNQQLMF